MSQSRESLLSFLVSHGISHQEERHAAVFTMAESATLEPSLEGCRCKNLLVQNKKRTDRFLLVTPPDAELDLSALGRQLGVGRLSFCSKEEMLALLGVEPGATSPLALWSDRQAQNVRLLLDSELKTIESFLFHPLINTATIAISSDGLTQFLKAVNHSIEFINMPRRVMES